MNENTYRLIKATTEQDLVVGVNGLIGEGFSPYGDLKISATPDGPVFYQVLLKTSEVEEVKPVTEVTKTKKVK